MHTYVDSSLKNFRNNFRITKFKYSSQSAICHVQYLTLVLTPPASATTNMSPRKRYLLWPERYISLAAGHLSTIWDSPKNCLTHMYLNVRNDKKQILIDWRGYRIRSQRCKTTQYGALDYGIKTLHPHYSWNIWTIVHPKSLENSKIFPMRVFDYYIWRFSRRSQQRIDSPHWK